MPSGDALEKYLTSTGGIPASRLARPIQRLGKGARHKRYSFGLASCSRPPLQVKDMAVLPCIGMIKLVYSNAILLILT